MTQQNNAELLLDIQHFSETILKQQATAFDQSEEYPEKIMEALFQHNLVQLALNPEKELDNYLDFLTIVQMVSKQFAAVGSILLTQATCGALPIFRFGTTFQKCTYLKSILSGEAITAFALNEAESGSFIDNIQTTAQKTTNGWVLNGTKTSISNAPIADLLLIVAKIADANLSNDQYGIFIVDRHLAGITIGEPELKMGIKALPVSSITLNNVQVSSNHLLGDELDGYAQTESILNQLRLAIAAQSIGIAEGSMALGIQHVTYDRRFGQRLIDLQNTQLQLAQAQTKIVAASTLLKEVATTYHNDTWHISMVKLFASETAVETTETILKVTGGYAYMRNNEIERYVRDAKLTEIYGSSATTHKRIIALPWVNMNRKSGKS